MTEDEPISAADFMRRLGMTLEVRPLSPEEGPDGLDTWTCRLRREDGRTWEVEGATFMVYDEEGDWQVEPTPTAVIDLLRWEGEDDEDASDLDGGDASAGPLDGRSAENGAEALAAFLGPEGLALLDRLADD